MLGRERPKIPAIPDNLLCRLLCFARHNPRINQSSHGRRYLRFRHCPEQNLVYCPLELAAITRPHTSHTHPDPTNRDPKGRSFPGTRSILTHSITPNCCRRRASPTFNLLLVINPTRRQNNLRPALL